MKMICKKLFFIFLCFPVYIAFSDSIISGFGIFYRLSYDEALKQIKKDNFTILEETFRRDTNTDRKMIKVDSFEYDGLPYKNGTFSFDREMDGQYYFSISEGDVDTDKIDKSLEYAAKFSVFLSECKNKYVMQTEESSNGQLIGFWAENNGCIILSISEKLHIAYFPKAPIR